MSRDALTFPSANAPRSLWVFLLDIEPSQIDTWEKPGETGTWPLPAALGVETLDPAEVEVFPADRISEYGMARYLTEANGMDPAQIAEDLQLLESLTGVIVIVHARAVAGRDGKFDPAHPARFVGHYGEAVGLSASTPQAPRPSASGEIMGAPADGPSRMPWGILVGGLAVVVLIALLIWGFA